MYVASFDSDVGKWSEGACVPYGKIELEPSATVLNYGQSIFEGLKAFRHADGSIKVFRPDRNANRLRDGAERMLLPPVAVDDFLAGVDAVVAANARWVPPYKAGTLYLRPILFGSGAALGVSPSLHTTFCIFSAAVGNYFKGSAAEAPTISLQVAPVYRRSMPGGVGGTKCAGNYAPCFIPSREAKAAGFSETLFVDATTSEFIEEAGASNLFAVLESGEGLELVTPPIDRGTILPGVTRDSVLTLAREELGAELRVSERPLRLSELSSAREIFCTGTGASLTSVAKVGLPDGGAYEVEGWGDVSRKLASRLFAIQWGDDEDTRGWTRDVKPL